MNNLKLLKSRKVLLGVVAAMLAVCIIIPVMTASAEMVDVYTVNDPTFEFTNIWSPESKGYKPSDDNGIVSQENGTYVMKSNAWGSWYSHCAAAYSYTQSQFNAGDDSILTVKTTIDTFNGKEVGIQIRESLDANSMLVMATVRTDGFYFIRREATGIDCQHNAVAIPTTFGADGAPNPIHLKLTLNRTKGRVIAMYKMGGDIDSEEGWSNIHTMTFKGITALTEVYTGMYSSSTDSGTMSSLKWSHWSVNLQAPEGYVIGGGGGDDTPSVPEITLPEDDAAPGDALLRETFTDNVLTPRKETVTDPYWIVRKGEAVVTVDEAKTNRYLYVEAGSDPLMMTAGDMGWTDYSAQMEFAFTEDIIDSDENRIELLFRHRTQYVGGSGDYSVVLRNILVGGKFSQQVIQLRYRPGCDEFIPNENLVVLAEKVLSTKEMLAPNETHTFKVHVVDTRITVYFDDMQTPLFDYTDDGSMHKNTGDPVNDSHLKGCIGIVVGGTSAIIDNIVVRDLPDPLGGDWDNEIQGNYDSPVPDWLRERYGK